MSADPAIRRATYADLEAVPPHLVAEIVDGRLETHHHGVPVLGAALSSLSCLLEQGFGRRTGGDGAWVFLPRSEFHFRESVLVPDLAGWMSDWGAFNPDADFITLTPNWVCEILSSETARLDRGAKRRLYGEAGVDHLWLLDTNARLLECFDRSGSHWRHQATYLPGDEVRVAPFDALGFPMDALFPFDEPAPQKPSEEA